MNEKWIARVLAKTGAVDPEGVAHVRSLPRSKARNSSRGTAMIYPSTM
jgi:hypothetical protein